MKMKSSRIYITCTALGSAGLSQCLGRLGVKPIGDDSGSVIEVDKQILHVNKNASNATPSSSKLFIY